MNGLEPLGSFLDLKGFSLNAPLIPILFLEGWYFNYGKSILKSGLPLMIICSTSSKIIY